MEDTLGDCHKGYALCQGVLILVLMEDTLGELGA